MLQMNRRNFVLSATTAGLVFGLDKPLEIIPSAMAQATGPHPMNPKGAKFHKFKVGGIEVTTVYDGDIYRQHDAAFIKNASIDDTKASLRASNLPDDRVPNAYTVTFVTIGGRTYMFDSGNGAGGAPGTGTLDENMKAAGIDASKLSAIVVGHFHPDHIFGLFTKDNAQVYANTEIIVPEGEYKFWTDATALEKLPEARRGLARRIQATIPQWKNIKQVAGDKDAVPGIRVVPTPGHTPGHTSFLVSDGGGQVLVLGDVTNLPAINLRNPGWHVAFDQDATMAEATRRRTFDRVVADKLVCTGYHWGMPGAGNVVKDGNGYALVPVA